MRNLIKNFRELARKEDGAVTVDWVVLTGIIIVAGIGAVSTVFTVGIDGIAGGITDSLENAQGSLEGLNPVAPGDGDGDGDG